MAQNIELQIDVQALFATPVATIRVPDAAALNDELTTVVLAREQAQPSTEHSNRGGWQSTWDFEKWGGSAGDRLMAIARGVGNKLTRLRDGGDTELKWKHNAWANINRSDQGNEFHTHPGSVWSGAYYVDDGGASTDPSLGGEFEVADPRGPAPAMYLPALVPAVPGGESFGASTTLSPATGTMLMFPAWLSHAVRPYRGTGQRISIAFNLFM